MPPIVSTHHIIRQLTFTYTDNIVVGYTKDYDAKQKDIWLEIEAMIAVRGVEGLVQIQGHFLDTKMGVVGDKLYLERFPVIVMELLRGGPLFGRINYRDSISEKFITHIFKKMIGM
jgi:serine/threonine protein kinase